MKLFGLLHCIRKDGYSLNCHCKRLVKIRYRKSAVLDYAGLHVLFFITKKHSFFCIQINIAADEFRATHSLYRKSASWIIGSSKSLHYITFLLS